MKISDPNGKPRVGLEQFSAPVAGRQSGRSTSPAGQPSEADRVQLSNLSAHLSAALGNSTGQVEKVSLSPETQSTTSANGVS